MKKLVVLLASAMMFSFSATAFAATAFTDMADQTKVVNDAVNKGVALEIIEGYADGTFRPDATITRAEFAKIAVTAAGAEKTATMLEGTASEFSDVQANAWYTGWVNAAASLGYVQGDEAGTYRPNDTIKNSEVIAVLLRLLGYNDNLNGAWPTNYITQANKMEVLDDVNVSAAAAATRGDVAVILDAILDQDLVKYSKDTETFELTTKNGETLLADSFKGSVSAATNGTDLSIKDAEDKTFKMSVQNAADVTKTMIFTADTVVSDNVNLFDLDNHQLEVIYKYDSSKDEYTAKYVDVKSSAVVSDDVDYVDATTIKVDGKKYTTTSDMTGKNAGENVNFTVFFDKDGDVYDVVADALETGKTAIIDEVDDNEIEFVTGTVLADFEYDEEDHVIIDAATGEYITAEDLEAGDALQTLAVDVYAKVPTVTGTFTKAVGSMYTIDGAKYEAAGVRFYDDELDFLSTADYKDYLGEEVTFVANADNTIDTIITGEKGDAAYVYGVIVDYSTSSSAVSDKAISDVTIFTEEGKTVTYELTSNAKGSTADEGIEDLSSDVTKLVSQEQDYQVLGQLVSYKLNDDGEIKLIDNAGTAIGNALDVKDSKYMLDGGTRYTLASDAVVFNITVDNADLEVALVSRADVLGKDDITANTDSDDINLSQFIYATMENNVIDYMAVSNMSGDSDILYGIVEEVNAYVVDLENAIKIDGTYYELKSGTYPAKKSIVGYTVSGTDVTIDSERFLASYAASAVTVTSINDDVIAYATGTCVLADDAIVYTYDISEAKYILGEKDDIEKDSVISVVDKNNDGEVTCIVVQVK